MKRRPPWRRLFLLGLATGLAALAIGGPRTWSAALVRRNLNEALAAGQTEAAGRWFAPFVRQWRELPSELISAGRRLAGLNDPEALEKYADTILDFVGAPGEAVAAARFWQCEAAAQRDDRARAADCFRAFGKEFWDYPQALEAEQALQRLTNRAAAESITAAALARDWDRVRQLTADFESRELFSEDRDLIAAHVLEALLAAARPDEAKLRLQNWARPNGGFNIPAVILPTRLERYPAALTVLDEVARDMDDDNPWRVAVVAVAAALRGDAGQLRRLAPELPAGHLVDLTGYLLQRGLPREDGEALLAAAERRELNALERLRLAIHAARARLAWGDRAGAGQAVAAGLAIEVQDPTRAELEILGVQADETGDWTTTVAQYETIIERHAGDERVLSLVLGEAQHYLLTGGRAKEACELARRHAEKVENTELRESLLQPCKSF